MKKIIIGTMLGLAIVGGGFALWHIQKNDSPANLVATQEELDSLNAGDPTLGSEQHEDSGDDTTEGSGSQTDDTGSSDQSTKGSVGVTITSAGVEGELVVVRSFANSFEEGTCTATFRKTGEAEKVYTENTELQSSYTQCNPFQIPQSDFSSGTWSVVVVFNSPHYEGTSASWEFSR